MYRRLGLAPGRLRIGDPHVRCDRGRTGGRLLSGDDTYPVPKLVHEWLGFTALTRTDWFGRKLSDGGDTLPR